MENSIENTTEIKPRGYKILTVCFVVFTAVVYYFSNPKSQFYYDYTFRVAENFLRGAVAFTEPQPSWLNEFVPFEGFFYSVFPLGSVLTMIPFVLLKFANLVTEMPSALIAGLTAGGIGWFLISIAKQYPIKGGKIFLMSAAILYGTWMWTNLTMGGAWHLALGFAMLGELGAIYFTIFNRKPLLAGAFFALGFGNRTEVLLTAPIFMFLLVRQNEYQTKTIEPETQSESDDIKQIKLIERRLWFRQIALFCAIPFVLGVSTLVYNYIRFHSFTDFGYARIPGVLNEPWYNHGIFSVWYIPGQAHEMLFKMWERRAGFPYLVPNEFSGSILWSSPLLLLLFRFGSRDKILKYASWLAIFVLTILLWMHGNSGGWQFGYRYAMVLLPWIFLIILENGGKKITFTESVLVALSFAVNLWATYLFFWTDYIRT